MIPPRLPWVAAAAVLALAVAGCGGATDSRPARWPFISATIMEPSCATVNCHSAITHQGGVDLSAAGIGYETLVGKAGDGGFQTFYVYPYYPQYSSVVNLMNAEGSIRMPPDNPLPQADITLIENWILQGAHEN